MMSALTAVAVAVAVSCPIEHRGRIAAVDLWARVVIVRLRRPTRGVAYVRVGPWTAVQARRMLDAADREPRVIVWFYYTPRESGAEYRGHVTCWPRDATIFQEPR